MKKTVLSLLFVTMLALLVFIGCQQPEHHMEYATSDDLVADVKAHLQEGIATDSLKTMLDTDAGGFVLIDVRDCDEVPNGMIPGAKWIPRGKLEFKIAGIVPGKETRIVTYCKTGGRAVLAAEALQRLGYTHVRFQEGGFDEWKKAYPDMVEINLAKFENSDAMVADAKQRVKPVSTEELKAKLAAQETFTLIDVRDTDETKGGMIPTAINIPRGKLEFKIADTVADKATPIVVYCKTGGRAALSAETLGKLGFTDVKYLEGGWDAWSGVPSEKH